MTQHNLVLVANATPSADDFNDVLVEEGEQRFFADGSVIQKEGDTPIGFHVILSGRVLVEHFSAEKAPVALRILGDGEIYSVRAIAFPETPAANTVTALADTHTVIIRPHTLDRIRHRVPRLDYLAMLAVARELADVQRCLVEATHATAEERVRSRLVTLCDAYAGQIRFSQRVLADLAGTTRPTVNRVLQQLQSDGVLKVQRSRVEILDRDGLSSSEAG